MPMILAMIILMITALPVLYYYYCMYYVNEKTRYLIGIFAGVWALIGVPLIKFGVVGFSYFIIFIILIVIVYVFEFIMGLISEDFQEAEQEEYEIEWPIDVSNIMMGILIVFMIILLYLAFFIVPVSPAKVDDPTGFDEEEGKFKSLPNAYKYEYKSLGSRTYVVVITARSIPLTQGLIKSTMDDAKPYVEDYIKEKYSVDAKLRLKEEGEIEKYDHDVFEQIYDVHSASNEELKLATMKLHGFFYHEDFELIIIGFVHPWMDPSDANDIINNLEF